MIVVGVCVVTSGNQVLEGFGFDTRLWYRWVDLAIVAGFAFGLLFVAYLYAIIFYFLYFFFFPFFLYPPFYLFIYFLI